MNKDDIDKVSKRIISRAKRCDRAIFIVDKEVIDVPIYRDYSQIPGYRYRIYLKDYPGSLLGIYNDKIPVNELSADILYGLINIR